MEFGNSKKVTILIAEDDDGHAELISDNLLEAGITNPIIRFRNGQETLDFFFGASAPTSGECSPDVPRRVEGRAYMLLLDIRMPKVGGVEVLRQIKADPQLKNMPVIMLTTTDDPREIQNCYALGCSCYVTKPVDYQQFSEMLVRLGLFLLVVQVPSLNSR
ncbi:MAG: response regulator [Desulfuromonadales bacterium]|nr:response regulator [Desulfuromonadales bacterium]